MTSVGTRMPRRVKSNVTFLPVGGFPGISETVADRDVLGRRDLVGEAVLVDR
jgi:hypothetical protein